MVLWIICTYGSKELKEEYLPDLCSMRTFASYCLTEAGSGSDAVSLKTKAEYDPKSETYTINGSKSFISGGSVSSVYVVMARTDEKEISCFLIDTKKNSGVSFGSLEHKMGWKSMPTCIVNFDNVHIPKEHLLGKVGEGFKIAMRALDGGRINIGTTSIGGAIESFNIALQYTSERKQFGQSIQSFQNTQFSLAENFIQLQSARLMIQNSSKLLDAKDEKATIYCAAAKKFATDTGFHVANSSLQMLGGYGYLRDYTVERIVRDLRVHQILEGTNEIMKLIIARHLIK